MSTTGRRDLPPAKPEALAALLTPPASAQRHDLIVSRMAAWRVLGSPWLSQSDDALRAFVERLVDYAPYQPAGLARQLAAILTALLRNDRLARLKAPALVIHRPTTP